MYKLVNIYTKSYIITISTIFSTCVKNTKYFFKTHQFLIYILKVFNEYSFHKFNLHVSLKMSNKYACAKAETIVHT